MVVVKGTENGLSIIDEVLELRLRRGNLNYVLPSFEARRVTCGAHDRERAPNIGSTEGFTCKSLENP